MSSIGPARTANICMRTEAGRSTGSSCHNQLTYSSTIARLGASTADNDREHPQPQISIGVIRARAPSTLVQADPIRTGVAVHPGISFLWRTGNSGTQGAGADAETCYHKCEPVNENVSQGEAVRAFKAITLRGRLTIRDPHGTPRKRQGRPWQWRKYQDELPADCREGAAVRACDRAPAFNSRRVFIAKQKIAQMIFWALGGMYSGTGYFYAGISSVDDDEGDGCLDTGRWRRCAVVTEIRNERLRGREGSGSTYGRMRRKGHGKMRPADTKAPDRAWTLTVQH